MLIPIEVGLARQQHFLYISGMNLGSAIKKRREDLGLTQQELGRRLKVTGMTVSRWELGEVMPQRRHWPKIEKALGKRLDEMMMVSMFRETA